jgi:hypothetical protein
VSDIDRLLITGAAGRVGEALRVGLRGRFRVLRLLDWTFRAPGHDDEELFGVPEFEFAGHLARFRRSLIQT